MQAFRHAVVLQADGVELDVRASRDGQVVVHHDRTLNRTTRLQGPVADYDAIDLERAGVPRLRDVLHAVGELRVIVEIKVDDDEFGRLVANELRKADAVERACVGGFRRGVLRAVRAAEPTLATSAAREEVRLALYRSWLHWPVTRTPYQGYQIPEMAGRTRVVSQRFIADAHKAGLGVQVWTVDDVDTAARLLGWGVDALITDRPDLMMPLVRELGDRAQNSSSQSSTRRNGNGR